MKVTKIEPLHCDASDIVVPAQAGTHPATAIGTDEWAPTFVGARICFGELK